MRHDVLVLAMAAVMAVPPTTFLVVWVRTRRSRLLGSERATAARALDAARTAFLVSVVLAAAVAVIVLGVEASGAD